MKKFWIYITLTFFEILLGLTYGFFLQNIISVEICLFIAFFVPFFIISISLKNEQDLHIKIIEILFLSLLLMAVFMAVFLGGNQLRQDFFAEYDVTVEFVNGRLGEVCIVRFQQITCSMLFVGSIPNCLSQSSLSRRVHGR